MSNWERETDQEERQRPGLMEKVLNFFGLVSEEIEDQEEEIPPGETLVEPPRRNKPRVVALQGAQRQFKVVVFEPKTFEEVQAIVDQLKNHRPVIVNLEESDRALARRIVDFMSGATYALAGAMQKISASIFLFTPAEVEITLGPRAEPRDRSGLFNV